MCQLMLLWLKLSVRCEMEVFYQMTPCPQVNLPHLKMTPQQNGQHFLTGNTQPAF